MTSQLPLFLQSDASDDSSVDNSTTFVPNQKLAVHRWFRYSAGFSAEWARSEIERHCNDGEGVVFDPFAGSATTLLAAQRLGVDSIGLEPHPFVYRVAEAKLDWTNPHDAFREATQKIIAKAKRYHRPTLDDVPSLLEKIYDPEILKDLYRLRRAVGEIVDEDSPMGRLSWLAYVSMLRSCSNSGTAPWQYVLPNKTKANVAEPFYAFEQQAKLMAEDMELFQATQRAPATARILQEDARSCPGVEDNSVDFVITSPPYPNNYDYADATRIELTVLGEVERWADLHDVIRKHLMRSCSQHMSKDKTDLDELLSRPVVEPIRDELTEACMKLDKLRQERAGRKKYHRMVAAYFVDMGEVWRELSRVTKKGALACFVVGDSAPYGVHIPVEDWLGELAGANGFDVLGFDETRKRNIKWDNRTHKVPLHEGRLWLKKG